MLEPSSSEEDEDYEPSSGIQNNAKDNNLKPPVANGGPRPVSPSTTDGKPGGKVRTYLSFNKSSISHYVCLLAQVCLENSIRSLSSLSEHRA